MTLAKVLELISSGEGDSEIAQKLVDAGIVNSHSNTRKGVGFVRKMQDVEQAVLENTGRTIEQDFAGGTAKEVFTVDNPPTTLQEALQQSQTDLQVWQVEKWIWNHWAGRYQIKIFFQRKTTDANEAIKSLLADVASEFTKAKPRKVSGEGVGVAAFADFHYGMDYKGDAKNRPFNIASLTESIQTAVAKVNALGLQEVQLVLLGDFIESFTGLNHTDTWKHLSSYGRTAIKGVASLLRDELITKINNVSKIYIVAGNHDRVSMKSDLDSVGEGAGLIADFLELMVDVPIEFNYALLNPEIDGVKYILTHGHLGLSKRDEYATILEHGDQHKYNVMLQGHYHSRDVRKAQRFTRNAVSQVVSLEGSNFRKVVVPPMVSGGAFSSSLGLHSTCGLTVIRSNGAGGVDHLDLSV